MRIGISLVLMLFAGCQWGERQVSPSFDCAMAQGEVQQQICADPELAKLDQEMERVYRAALAVAADGADRLRASQRGVIKGRDECWKSDDLPACVAQVYRLRIAELQARYRLLEGDGPLFFQCGESPANELVITRYATQPATLIAERGDQVSLMYRQPGDGIRYFGRNESITFEGEVIALVWGFEASALRCVPR